MRRLFRCCTGFRGPAVQPDGIVTKRHNKMLTSRLHSVGIMLQIQGIFVCIIQGVAAAVLPAVTFIWVYDGNMRLSIEAFVHWGVSTAAAVLGIIGLASLSSVWLSMHIALGGLAAAALAAHDTVTFGLLELRCGMTQAALSGCGSCACAATDACTQSDLDSGSCSTCQAYSTELCNKVGSNTVIIAITGAVTLVTMAVPIIFSLLALIRVEHYRSTQHNRLHQDRDAVTQQTALLDEGQPLSVPHETLQASMDMLLGSRFGADHDLARRAALALRLHSVPAISSKPLPSLSSLAACEAGMFANPAYSPPTPAAETLKLQRPAPLVRKSSIGAIKAAIVAKALPLLRNPLEAIQQRRSNSVNPPAPSQEAEENGLEEGGSQSVMLAVAGDEDMGTSMQAAAVDVAEEDEVVHLERSRSKSTKHHRKKHMQPAPSNSEALNLMSSVYSAAGESLVKTNRQHGTAACKAEQEYSGEDAECV